MMKSEIIEKLKTILQSDSAAAERQTVEQLSRDYENAEGENTLDEEFNALLNAYKEKEDALAMREEPAKAEDQTTGSGTAEAIAEEHEEKEQDKPEEKEILSEGDLPESGEQKTEQQGATQKMQGLDGDAAKEEKPGDDNKEGDTADAMVEEHNQNESEEAEEKELLSESDVGEDSEKATAEKPGDPSPEEELPKTKEAIVEKLKELLETEAVAKIKQAVRDLKKEFNSLTKSDIESQKKAWDEEEHDEEDEFFAKENPLDKQFNELLDEYHNKVKEHAQKIQAEREKNLEEKKQIISELKALVKEEENIGKLFSVFNELQDKWNSIGHIPGDSYREVQDTFHKIKDEFYYNVDIYKQLKEHDLHINEKHKQELIEKIKEVKKIKSIKEREALVKTYQREWMDLGPSPRETYKEMADEFFGTCREIFEEIQKHYDKLHAEHEQNLEKKQALVQKMEELLSLEIKNHSTWKKKTDEVIALQKEWKTIGFAPREHNESIWKTFRGLCDTFFDRKREFYDQRRELQEKHKEQKEKLAARAEELQDSSDWKEATRALIDLQNKWKEVGAAAQRDEQRLWQKFRGACDTFFNRKKEFFGSMDERQEENLKLKNELIKEIENAELSGKKEEDIQLMKDFSKRFNEIGFVPKKNLQEVYDRYNKALDEKYEKLNLDRHEKAMLSYKQRVSSISDAPDSDHLVRKEKRLLHDKIDRLKQRVIQYENNMEFLSGDGAASFKKEYERKIDKAKGEIDEIKEKLDLLP